MNQVYRSHATEPLPADDPFPWMAFTLWMAGWAGFAAIDTWVHKRDGTTLSRLAKQLRRRIGPAAFTTAYAGGAYILYRHVARGDRR